MQMYEGLPVITNKITLDEQRGTPHHLLGLVSLNEEPWRVSTFKRQAENVIKEIRSRGRLPILVGGTHYYTQSLLFDNSLVSEDGEPDAENDMPREDINRKYPILERPTEEILDQLKKVDPIMAKRWHPNDRRKIQRSLEIYLTTGKQASQVYLDQRAKKIENSISSEDESSTLNSTLLLWVHADPEVLKARLDARVDKMMESGLLDEVRSLGDYLHRHQAAGEIIDRTRGIWVSIGFKEFESYLSGLAGGTLTSKELDILRHESIEQTKAATRQYSKRQVRWIRIKLLGALQSAGLQKRLFVLDGTDITQWNETVSDPAVRIVADFLSGRELPVPGEISSIAAELLFVKQAYDLSDRPDLWVRQVCELCNMTAVTEEQWQRHLESRSHRRASKKSKASTFQSPRHLGSTDGTGDSDLIASTLELPLEVVDKSK